MIPPIDVTKDGFEISAVRRPDLHWWIGVDRDVKHVVVLHFTLDGTFRSDEVREFTPDSFDDAVSRTLASVRSAIRAVS